MPSELPGRVVVLETPKGRKRFLITAPRVREGRPGYSGIAVDSKGNRLDDQTYFLSDVLKAKLLRRRRFDLGEVRLKQSTHATGGGRSERRERGFTDNEDTSNRPEEYGSVFDHFARHVDSDKDGRSSVNDADEIGDNIYSDLVLDDPDGDDQGGIPPGYRLADD